VPVMLVRSSARRGDGPGSRRGLEYDTVSDNARRSSRPRSVENRAGHKVRFTKDRKVARRWGGSPGAACAPTMAWSHRAYRRVRYSGTFVDQARGLNPAHLFGAGGITRR
jgi:hypothetical protein